MSTLVLAVVVGLIALAGIITSLVSLPRRLPAQAPGGDLRGPVLIILLLGLVGVGLTIPVAPPFALGMRLGVGFGVGIVIALIGLWVLALHEARVPALSGAGTLRVVSAVLGVGLLGLLGLALGLRGYADDAIIGAALGVLAGLLVARPALRADVTPALDWFATTFAILAAGQYLAVHHFPGGGLLAQLAPLVVGAVMLAGLLIASTLAGQGWLAEDKSLSLLVTTGTALVLMVLLGQVAGTLQAAAAKAAMLPKRMHELSEDGLVLALGAVTGALLLWLLYSIIPAMRSLAEGGGRQLDAYDRARRMAGTVAAALLVIVLLTIGFRQLAGWGLVLVLLPLAVGAACALGQSVRWPCLGTMALRVLQLGALVLIWRVLLQRAGPDRHPETDQYYTLIGLLLGLGLPLLLRDLLAVFTRTSSFGSWVAATIRLLVPVIILPLAVFVVWDFKALVGLYWGFIAMGFYVLYIGLGESAGPPAGLRQAGQAPLLALLMGLIGVQFMPLLMPLTDLSRPHKLGMVIGLLVVAVIWISVEHVCIRPAGEEDATDAS